MLGVVTRSFSRWTDESTGYLGYTGDSRGWSSAGSNPYLLPGGRAYGTAWRNGDIVEMHIDMEKHTISYTLNQGSSLGVAFTDLPNEVCVAVTLYDATDQVSII